MIYIVYEINMNRDFSSTYQSVEIAGEDIQLAREQDEYLDLLWGYKLVAKKGTLFKDAQEKKRL